METADDLERLCRFTLAGALVEVLDDRRRRRWASVLAADVPCDALAEAVSVLRRELSRSELACDVATDAESALHDLRRARSGAGERFVDSGIAACRRACRAAASGMPHSEKGLLCALVGAGVDPGQAMVAVAVACSNDFDGLSDGGLSDDGPDGGR